MAMLEYACTSCDWWSTGNDLMVGDCPRCGEKVVVFSDEAGDHHEDWRGGNRQFDDWDDDDTEAGALR